MSISEKQRAIAAELKAPKGQYNSFGKYNYRSCEDILEAVKPLLVKHEVSLYITDNVQMVGERYYVVAEACLLDEDGSIYSHGWAREDDSKKGMDGSQITGTASSYARKYALNALFLIDDTKDADTDEHRQQTSQKQHKKPRAPKEQMDEFTSLVSDMQGLMGADTAAQVHDQLKLVYGETDEGKLDVSKIGEMNAYMRMCLDAGTVLESA